MSPRRKNATPQPGNVLPASSQPLGESGWHLHDAYIRLVDVEQVQRWNSRGHFFGAAAEAMRRILVEIARRKKGPKAGGDRSRVELQDIVATTDPNLDVIALSDSLDRLESKDRRTAELVKLRFFAGLTRQQAADLLGVSIATVDNDWAYAKGWLKADMASPTDNK